MLELVILASLVCRIFFSIFSFGHLSWSRIRVLVLEKVCAIDARPSRMINDGSKSRRVESLENRFAAPNRNTGVLCRHRRSMVVGRSKYQSQFLFFSRVNVSDSFLPSYRRIILAILLAYKK